MSQRKLYNPKRHTMLQTAPYKEKRDELLAELSAFEVVSPPVRKLMSLDGFISYYLRFVELYPTHDDAYEALEDCYQRITGKRKYSEYCSFRVLFQRYRSGKTKCQIKRKR